ALSRLKDIAARECRRRFSGHGSRVVGRIIVDDQNFPLEPAWQLLSVKALERPAKAVGAIVRAQHDRDVHGRTATLVTAGLAVHRRMVCSGFRAHIKHTRSTWRHNPSRSKS